MMGEMAKERRRTWKLRTSLISSLPGGTAVQGARPAWVETGVPGHWVRAAGRCQSEGGTAFRAGSSCRVGYDDTGVQRAVQNRPHTAQEGGAKGPAATKTEGQVNMRVRTEAQKSPRDLDPIIFAITVNEPSPFE